MPERTVEVGRLSEIDDPGSIEFRIGDGEWPFRGFVVHSDGSLFAYQNVCPHAGHALNWKPDSFLTPDGSAIICASHGAVFEISTGACVAGPCPGRHLRALPTSVREGRIFVTGPDSPDG